MTEFSESPVGLVPDDVDDQAVAPFIYLTLATLGPLLNYEPAVKNFLGSQPELRQRIRDLSVAVGKAGVRVRDAGLMKDSFDQNLKFYTPAEIWTFDLAVDLIAMFGTLPDLHPGTRARIVDDLKSLDWNVHSHAWKKEVKRAGDGPAAFSELRRFVPRHTPHPGR